MDFCLKIMTIIISCKQKRFKGTLFFKICHYKQNNKFTLDISYVNINMSIGDTEKY